MDTIHRLDGRLQYRSRQQYDRKPTLPSCKYLTVVSSGVELIDSQDRNKYKQPTRRIQVEAGERYLWNTKTDIYMYSKGS
jgi:hypothetical protein